jgi:hypothetical protein
MMYHYTCTCGRTIDMQRPIVDRNEQIQCTCGRIMKRVLWKGNQSKTIGLMRASKIDGVGYMVDRDGSVCPPKTRGSSAQRKSLWKITK